MKCLVRPRALNYRHRCLVQSKVQQQQLVLLVVVQIRDLPFQPQNVCQMFKKFPTFYSKSQYCVIHFPLFCMGVLVTLTGGDQEICSVFGRVLDNLLKFSKWCPQSTAVLVTCQSGNKCRLFQYDGKKSAHTDSHSLSRISIEFLATAVYSMTAFFSQVRCLCRLPSVSCMFCYGHPHTTFFPVQTGKWYIQIEVTLTDTHT